METVEAISSAGGGEGREDKEHRPKLVGCEKIVWHRAVRQLRRVRVLDLLESITVEDVGFVEDDTVESAEREYKVRLQFPSEHLYMKALELTFVQVRTAIQKGFYQKLMSNISKHIRKLGTGKNYK